MKYKYIVVTTMGDCYEANWVIETNQPNELVLLNRPTDKLIQYTLDNDGVFDDKEALENDLSAFAMPKYAIWTYKL